MKLPVTQSLFAYWDDQRGARCAPDRHELDPAAMRGVLAHTFLLEIDPQGRTFPIRVSGTRLDALFGRNLKGCAFAALWCPSDVAEMQAMLACVLDEAKPVVAGLAGAPEGYAPTSFELLVLPLRHQGRTHARVLCSLVAARTPEWLGLKAVTRVALRNWRSIDQRAARGERPTASRRHAHLVVHEGGLAAASAWSWQSHVNAPVPRSVDRLPLIRGS